MAYLLDTNVLIEAHDQYYRPTCCPGFWEWLIHRNRNGLVYSTAEVLDEIRRQEDWLAEWATTIGAQIFLPTDSAVTEQFAAVRAWAEEPASRYSPVAVRDFLSAADSFLVAHGLAHGHTVVTRERPAPGSKKTIKLPDACNGVRVKWLDPFTMLKREGARFVLAKA